MRPTVRARLIRLVGAGALVGSLLLPAAAPVAAADPVVLRVGTTQDLDSLNPYATLLSSRLRRVPAQLQPAGRLRAGPRAGPRLRRHVAAGGRWPFLDLPYPRRHEVVGRPAGDVRRCLLLVAARHRRDRQWRRRQPGRRIHRPGSGRRRRDQGRVPGCLDDDRHHRRRLRPDPADLPPDPPEAHLGQGDLQDDRRCQVRCAARGDRPYLAVEWQTGQFVRFQRNPTYWGTQAYPDEIDIQIFKSADSMVQALKAGEIDYAHRVERGPAQRPEVGPEHPDGRRQLERLDPARLQHLRHRDRQDDRQGRAVHQGACWIRSSAMPLATPSTTRP